MFYAAFCFGSLALTTLPSRNPAALGWAQTAEGSPSAHPNPTTSTNLERDSQTKKQAFFIRFYSVLKNLVIDCNLTIFMGHTI